ncbi:MAE_28990/MAE_18760 family HEPN-like nuclease [Corynebacterium tuscaniense]|uniref:MAE_28990/MAE_18760 family HEPN-like nuclease n=1 Tax=Corynebacterium tuscaniense TaxID=302449 RepID=UPI00050F3F9E|nr:MAE_28990/MAE_18760 family HEPN-like nuclease [Corynebacterium tuscaniense]KGF22712.1 hypothetical protein HMPREF2129_06715 [Corynebacterium tuscaniense DNF00037]
MSPLDRFEDAISKETAWRKKELTTLRFLLQSANEMERKFLSRAGLVLLYSHWEGWIKNLGLRYLEFVNSEKHTLKELRPEFVGAIVHPKIKTLENSLNPEHYAELIEYLRQNGDAFNSIKPVFIDTGSNLDSKTLKRIVTALGLIDSQILADQNVLTTKATFIDTKLVEKRHNIAHGQYLYISSEDFDDVYYGILETLEVFTTALSDAASKKLYLRQLPLGVSPQS